VFLVAGPKKTKKKNKLSYNRRRIDLCGRVNSGYLSATARQSCS
jgi:hypothetical protein